MLTKTCKGQAFPPCKAVIHSYQLSDRCRLGELFDDEEFAEDAPVYVHGEGRECDRKKQNERKHCAYGRCRGQSLDPKDYEGMKVD